MPRFASEPGQSFRRVVFADREQLKNPEAPEKG